MCGEKTGKTPLGMMSAEEMTAFLVEKSVDNVDNSP